MELKDLYERLNKIAKSQKKALGRAALATGVGKSTISSWKGGAMPKIDNLSAIAEFYGASLDYIVFGKGKEREISPESLKIAQAAEKLDENGKKIALEIIVGLELTHPFAGSKSINSAN
jgi:transcriptional regulator with XRE-family HTH domain